MAVVEGGQQPDVGRQQHAVAEHVAAHVADTDDAEVLGLRVVAEAAEVALHALPGAARGDGHLLVVVADRAARGEGVAEPEAVFGGDGVGVVGEGGGALVGGHHQVGVVAVVTHHIHRRGDLAADQVVGHVEQAAQVGLVAGHALLHQRLTVAGRRWALQDEAALGADRHDDHVLHLLGLDQAQHLGAKVFHPVRPAQAAARHTAKAQVHTFDPRRRDEDLEHRPRLGQARHLGRVELERQHRLGPAVREALEEVGAQRGFDQRQVVAQDAVFVEVGHAVERGPDAHHDARLQRIAVFLERGVEARLEQRHQVGSDRGVRGQRLFDVGLAEGECTLLHVAGIGPQHGHAAPVQAGQQHQPVEVVVVVVAAPGA